MWILWSIKDCPHYQCLERFCVSGDSGEVSRCLVVLHLAEGLIIVELVRIFLIHWKSSVTHTDLLISLLLKFVTSPCNYCHLVVTSGWEQPLVTWRHQVIWLPGDVRRRTTSNDMTSSGDMVTWWREADNNLWWHEVTWQPGYVVTSGREQSLVTFWRHDVIR